MGNLIFIYGLVCYATFLATFIYAIGFVGNLQSYIPMLDSLLPKSIDSGFEQNFIQSILINLSLLSAFAIQHSVMARKSFKNILTMFIPKSMERSTYVLLSSLVLILLFWQWQPLQTNIWTVSNPYFAFVLHIIFAMGWLTVLMTTFLINHFDLFGLRQVYFALRKKELEPISFRTPGPYKICRHPLYLGFIIAFWVTPIMSLGHLIFAIGTTGYIFLGILLEEKDMVSCFGDKYTKYQKEVPKIIPGVFNSKQ